MSALVFKPGITSIHVGEACLEIKQSEGKEEFRDEETQISIILDRKHLDSAMPEVHLNNQSYTT